MSADPARKQPPPPSLSSSASIQYLGYESGPDCREYRLAVRSCDGSTDVRFRIALGDFAVNRLLLQDGPDVCYQILLRMLAVGDTPSEKVVTIGAAELVAYREAHTPPQRRSVTPKSPPRRAPVQRTAAPLTHPKLPVAGPSVTAVPAEPSFAEGQRVSHAVFGTGVTVAASDGRTAVHFDGEGLKTFVTSLVDLEVLSGPHTWEVGPGGKTRQRQPRLPR